MILAYILIVHRNFHQVKELIGEILTENSTVFVCVDSKSYELKETLEKHYKDNFSVRIVEKSFDIRWGGFNMIRTIMEGIKCVISSGVKFRYVNLLSGQDFPIKNSAVIEEFFRGNTKEYIHNFELPNEVWAYNNYGMDRINYFYDFDNPFIHRNEYKNIMSQIGSERPGLEEGAIYGGLQWWSLTYECVEYIHSFLDENYKYINFFKYSALPDEMFFQTIVMNSKFKNQVENNPLRFIKWLDGKEHPKTLTMEDYDDIASSKGFWARKFDYDIDREIIKKIKNMI